MPQNVVRKKGKRHKFAGRNNGPARQRYRAEHRLEAHKVDALVKHNGMTRAAALDLWRSTRTRSR